MAAALQASMEQAEAAEAAENANKQPMEGWDGEQLCRHFGDSQFLLQVWHQQAAVNSRLLVKSMMHAERRGDSAL